MPAKKKKTKKKPCKKPAKKRASPKKKSTSAQTKILKRLGSIEKRIKAPPKKKRKTMPKKKKKTSAKKKVTKRKAGSQVGKWLLQILGQSGGIVAAKIVAKAVAPETGADNADWTWKNYAGGIAGALGAGGLAMLIKYMVTKSMSFKTFKNASSAGIAFVIYKALINEVVPKSEFLTEHLGLGADDYEVYGELGDYGAGDFYPTDRETYVMGADGSWRPVSESHRIPEYQTQGLGVVHPPSRDMGELHPPSSDMGAADAWEYAMHGNEAGGPEDPYARAYA